ncbi:hypothetical protein CC80DRAFT_46379 [Byssothecium circinans]|uniref:Uncharacterized protein n=1 Tax=Byssothecium circinans TaxID=147558 RepID=A0A6A5TXY8_9PLEO|nr:hypothetical protein CC80DRAFT_46379 [Byssothecium circinans]
MAEQSSLQDSGTLQRPGDLGFDAFLAAVPLFAFDPLFSVDAIDRGTDRDVDTNQDLYPLRSDTVVDAKPTPYYPNIDYNFANIGASKSMFDEYFQAFCRTGDGSFDNSWEEFKRTSKSEADPILKKRLWNCAYEHFVPEIRQLKSEATSETRYNSDFKEVSCSP